MSELTAPVREKERVYGLLDYALTAVYACLSGFAAGIAIGSPKTAWMFVAIIATGTFFSFLVQQLMDDQPIIRFDSILYVGVSILALVFSRDLAKLVPDQAFSGQLIVAGSLCWMLGLGSFFTWRDGTLLFQAVPGIALFGMVGVFDTFRAAPFLFFVFLMCLATLFARAHRRQMIEQAEASGYKASLDDELEDVSARRPKTSARLRAIYSGPWKWMAGPEWAFASAVVIVLVSLVSAPTLQFALQPLAGFVKVPPPPLTTQTRVQNPLGSGRDSSVRIGLGPLQLSNRPVLRVSLDQARYLRSRSYDTYDAGRWSQNGAGSGVTASSGAVLGRDILPYERALAEITRRVAVPFKVEVLDAEIVSIPVPGEIVNVRELENGDHAQKRGDGTLATLRKDDVIPAISGTTVVPDPSVKPVRAASQLPPRMAPLLDVETIPASVRAFAQRASEGKGTDYEKAIALQRAIETQVLYNLQAPAAPAGSDPVENFLFESKQGYCDVFGSSMTLMARSIGIPSRYVTGYYPIRRKVDQNGNWIINDTEAHAWAELFFEGVGWIAFDPTQGAAAVEGQGVGESNLKTPWYQSASLRRTLDVSIVAILVLGGVSFYLLRKRAAALHIPSRDDVGREYARFASTLKKASGKRRLPSDTPDDYLKTTEKALSEHAPAARNLNDQFVHALYSAESVSPEIVKQLRDSTDELAKEIRSNGKAGSPK